MNNYSLLKDFDPKASHIYIIDTNILMYLFSPIASYGEKKQEMIATFLQRSRNINAGLITTSSVIGEFFHVNLSIYFDLWCRGQKKAVKYDLKKDYRPTDDFKQSVKAINACIQSILKITQKFPDNFSSIDLNRIADHCLSAEFTDSYLLELSNNNGWIIVSNDGDLLNHPNRKNMLITPNF